MESQKIVIDCTVALSLLATRLPGVVDDLTKILVAGLAQETAQSTNVIGYAIDDVYFSLVEQDWEFRLTKKEEKLTSQFTPIRNDGGGNGGEPEPGLIIVP